MRAKLILLVILVSFSLTAALHAERAYWDESYVSLDPMDRGPDEAWDILYKDQMDFPFGQFCVGTISYQTIAEEDGDINHEAPAYGYYATQMAGSPGINDCTSESDLKKGRPGILFLHGDPLRGSFLLASYLA